MFNLSNAPLIHRYIYQQHMKLTLEFYPHVYLVASMKSKLLDQANWLGILWHTVFSKLLELALFYIALVLALPWCHLVPMYLLNYPPLIFLEIFVTQDDVLQG